MARSRIRSRILGLDVGKSRIGVAVSDELGMLAHGLATLQRARRGDDLAALQKLAKEHQAAGFVLGLPLQLSGDVGPQAAWVREFGAALAAATRLPVEYWDERLTTVAAEELAADQHGRGHRPDHRPDRGRIDQLAAVFILQSYLDRAK